MAIGTFRSRLIYLEDLAVTSNPAGQTDQVNVLGASSNPQTLHRIPIVLLTQFTTASNDADAATKGVQVGEIYYNTSTSKLHARMW